MSNKESVIADLRLRHGANVPILHSLPSSHEIVFKRSRLEFWTGALGYHRGMWKTWDGRILALLVIPATVAGHLGFWGPKIHTMLEYAEPYAFALQATGIQLSNELIGFGVPSSADAPLGIAKNTISAVLIPQVQSSNQTPSENDKTVLKLTLWRITNAMRDPLDATGVKGVGGFLTSSGHEVLYTADSPIGALDTVSAHLGEHKFHYEAGALILHKLEVQGQVYLANHLEVNSRSKRNLASLRLIGDNWMKKAESPILAYASKFSSNGFDYLLNVHHPKLKLKIIESYPITDMSKIPEV